MANRTGQIPKPTLNVLLIYDDVEIAARTHAMLAEAAKRPDDAWVHWEIRPWRLELLFLLPTADLALMDAAGAHLMVFALGGRADRSAGLLIWLETWAVHRYVQNAALALFEGWGGETFSASVTEKVAWFAERYGLSFLVVDANSGEDKAAPFKAARVTAERRASPAEQDHSRVRPALLTSTQDGPPD